MSMSVVVFMENGCVKTKADTPVMQLRTIVATGHLQSGHPQHLARAGESHVCKAMNAGLAKQPANSKGTLHKTQTGRHIKGFRRPCYDK